MRTTPPCIVHRTLIEGRFHYFGTMKEAKAASLANAKKHGLGGYMVQSLRRDAVVTLLNKTAAATQEGEAP